jgi:anti-sigma factor RsiW
MMCDQNRLALGAYLDGELPTDQASALEEHLRTCPACAAETAALLRTRRLLRAARTQFTPSADFKSRIQRQIAPAASRRSWLMNLLPACTAIAALLVIAFTWQHRAPTPDPFSEVADLHVNALASVTPYDVVSTDRHTVKPWFEGRIPFSFNVPELAGTSYTLLGGKLIYLDQQPAAQLIVGLRQHKISVLILQQSPALHLPDGPASRNAFAEDTWQSHGLRFIVIGDIPAADIATLSQTFKDANP